MSDYKPRYPSASRRAFAWGWFLCKTAKTFGVMVAIIGGTFILLSCMTFSIILIIHGYPAGAFLFLPPMAAVAACITWDQR